MLLASFARSGPGLKRHCATSEEQESSVALAKRMDPPGCTSLPRGTVNVVRGDLKLS